MTTSLDELVQQQEQYFEVDYVKHLGDVYNVFYDVLFDLLDQSRQEMRKQIQQQQQEQDNDENEGKRENMKRDCEQIDKSLEQLSMKMATVLESNYDAFEILCRELFVLPKNFDRDAARVLQEVTLQVDASRLQVISSNRNRIVERLRSVYAGLQTTNTNDHSDVRDREQQEGDAVTGNELRDIRTEINAQVKRHLELQEEELQLEHNLKVFEQNKGKLTMIDRILESKGDSTRDLLKRIIKEYGSLRELAARTREMKSEIESRQIFNTALSSSTSTADSSSTLMNTAEEGEMVNGEVAELQREEAALRRQIGQQAHVDPNIQNVLDMMDEGED